MMKCRRCRYSQPYFIVPVLTNIKQLNMCGHVKWSLAYCPMLGVSSWLIIILSIVSRRCDTENNFFNSFYSK